MPEVAVVYLDRWGNPERFPRAFLQSLKPMQAGAAFDLIWQIKGYPENKFSTLIPQFAKTFQGKIHEVRYPDNLYQFNLAFDAAKAFRYKYFIFFVSWSRVLASGWLRYYLDAFDRNRNCGVVSATGSYERIHTTQSFPNVHVRTNAFMMRREDFLSLDPGKLVTKSDGHLFEAGENSLTKQVQARGQVPIVVNRAGEALEQKDWPLSRTFRSGFQEMLLVADNRTHEFDVTPTRKRIKIARHCWGDGTPVEHRSLLRRMRSHWDWRFPHPR